jgi:hypothetical protein
LKLTCFSGCLHTERVGSRPCPKKVYESKRKIAKNKFSINNYYVQLKNFKMKKMTSPLRATLLSVIMIAFGLSSCTKSNMETSPSSDLEQADINSAVMKASTPADPNFNLEVILRGEDKGFGHVKFRQDNDAAKVITLGTWVRDLEPNHNYLLQRAVDTNIDGNCTGTSWLTLGKGLTPQSILTDEKGTGREELWRDVSGLATGAKFDIHFQIIDALTSVVVLTSGCYQYTVR